MRTSIEKIMHASGRRVRFPAHLFPFLLVLAVAFFSLGLAGAEAEKGNLLILRDGSVEERQAALHWLAEYGEREEVPGIVPSLKDADEQTREIAEEAIWAIWSRSGDPVVDEMLKMGVWIMVNGNPKASIDIFSRIIVLQPEFAEGYNKRAAALYLVGAYAAAFADLQETLIIIPSHFGAMSGAAFCLVRLERPDEALLYLNRALEINPNLEAVQELRKQLAGKAEKEVSEPLLTENEPNIVQVKVIRNPDT